jgi:hypothetical protein
VAYFVDCEEEVLVGCCADEVGAGEEGGREEGMVPEGNGEGELQEDDGEDEVFCEGLVTAELCYLAMLGKRG